MTEANPTEDQRCTCAQPEPALIAHGMASLCEKCGQPVVTDKVIARGICGAHFWGAPPGQDDLECPYCNGTLRTKS